MGLKIGDFLEDAGPGGIAAGIGAVILAPILLPAVAGVGKPIAKAAIKGGILLYEKSRGLVTEVGENFEDIVAEVRAELADEHQRTLDVEHEETYADTMPEGTEIQPTS